MKESNRENGSVLPDILKNSIKALGVTLFICVIAILLCTGLAMTAEHPRSFLPLGKCVFLAGSAICGFICGRKTERCGFLCGIISGILYDLSIILLSSFVGGFGDGIDLIFPFIAVLLSVMTACFGCTGKRGVNGAPSGIKKKKTVRFDGYNK